MLILVPVGDSGKQSGKLATIGVSNICDCKWQSHICVMYLKLSSWVGPLAWLAGSLHQTTTLCHPDLARSSCTFFQYDNPLAEGKVFLEGHQPQVHLLGLHGSCLPRVDFNEASFPLEPACLSPIVLLHPGREQSPLLWFCRVNKAALLILWASQSRGMCGGWAQRSRCASSNCLSRPGAFVLNLEASDQGCISKGQMRLHILSLTN